jgi:GT2 family glycosyltransferase
MRQGVCIGIHVHSEPQALVQTLRFLRLHTDAETEVVLLPDGADRTTLRALRDVPELSSLVQWGTPSAKGAAACFNRLTRGSEAEVLILLESGSLVGPQWLDLLLAALDRPACGLAGPSTNRAWNDQALFPRAAGSLAEVRHHAAQALRRFDRTVRTLEPLYSLSDFCYAVRRELVDTIGAADEAYGFGPCWEMDYNVRAARAGLHGLWACGAYVHRGPLTQRRAREEELRHDASRQLYQDRFCGLRLRGQVVGYQPHCRGEACEHFAPAELLTLYQPFGPITRSSGPAAPVPSATAAPLVSCVMATRGRPRFATQAIQYFLRQDYPNTELVIVEDGIPNLAGCVPDDPRIRLVSSGSTRTIGAMRNDACALARGEIVVLWDDDDWHGPLRVSRQVAPILAGDADVTALQDVALLDLGNWQCWRWSPELHSRMLALDVLSGTVAFRRAVWDRLARYPDKSLAEDAAFIYQAVGGGARLQAVDAADLYVYIRHGHNSWQLECGQTVDPAGWRAVEEPAMSGQDRAFYLSFAASQVSALGKAPER